MSGHSKWAGIKHRKAAVDAKRSESFAKLARELTVAARQGGGDPDGNYRLRLAIQKARDGNMPADNIERAIERGVGGKEGVQLDEIRYEGYGPHGVAIMVDVVTDNRNRTVAGVRNLFNRAGGSLGEPHSVGWMFTEQGVIRVAAAGRDPDELALELLDAVDVGEGGDIAVEGGGVEITLSPATVWDARRRLEEAGYEVEAADVSMNASTSVELDARQAAAVIRLLESLEEHDDVQGVHTNARIPDEVLQSVG